MGFKVYAVKGFGVEGLRGEGHGAPAARDAQRVGHLECVGSVLSVLIVY